MGTSKKINFVHYDPEMHWCKSCQEFPKTAKDYLTHLHSKEHQEMQKIVESPWHEKPMNDVSNSLYIFIKITKIKLRKLFFYCFNYKNWCVIVRN